MRSDSIYERYRERLNRLVDEQWPIKIITVAVQTPLIKFPFPSRKRARQGKG